MLNKSQISFFSGFYPIEWNFIKGPFLKKWLVKKNISGCCNKEFQDICKPCNPKCFNNLCDSHNGSCINGCSNANKKAPNCTSKSYIASWK